MKPKSEAIVRGNVTRYQLTQWVHPSQAHQVDTTVAKLRDQLAGVVRGHLEQTSYSNELPNSIEHVIDHVVGRDGLKVIVWYDRQTDDPREFDDE